MQILTEPKNALVKQYRKFFEYDGVDLQFTDDALHAIADEAITRSTGARALRTIIEEVMRDIMYEIPSQRDIKKVIITEETVQRADRALGCHDAPARGLLRAVAPAYRSVCKSGRVVRGPAFCFSKDHLHATQYHARAQRRARTQRSDLQTARASCRELPSELPLLPIRDNVHFPHLIFPLFVGREKVRAGAG